VIAADEFARTLAVDVDDLVDVGPVGFALGESFAADDELRALADLRAAYLERA
jgi:hypothetical protein